MTKTFQEESKRLSIVHTNNTNKLRNELNTIDKEIQKINRSSKTNLNRDVDAVKREV
jgi:hypothetical protein